MMSLKAVKSLLNHIFNDMKLSKCKSFINYLNSKKCNYVTTHIYLFIFGNLTQDSPVKTNKQTIK